MRVTPVPCFSDNYAYLVECETTGAVAIVDASEAAPIRAALGSREPRAIWSTHHHRDHVDGNEALAAAWGGLAIYGHASDRGRIPGQTEYLEDGATFAHGALSVTALHVPGHTLGAVTYFVVDPKSGERAAFTGDTFFLAGCGVLFEGTATEMHASLHRIADLGDDVQVYCGHEYTASNLAFAALVEPDNEAVRARTLDVKALRGRGAPTVPATIALERATNPYLRAVSVEEFGERRRAKDRWKG